MTTRGLVVAKAPVPGLAKTRLARHVGSARAAELASAALLDTLEACATAFGPRHCHLSLGGDLDRAVGAAELTRALTDWTVTPQRGDGLAERLAAAHAEVPGPVLQVGMDTPQAGAGLLREIAATLEEHDAVLGPAEDSGWWVLGLREPARAAVLTGVPMSAPTTYADTREALRALGLRVGVAPTLRDVDEADDAVAVAGAAPHSRFGVAWHRLTTLD